MSNDQVDKLYRTTQHPEPVPVSSLSVDELMYIFLVGTDTDQMTVMRELRRRDQEWKRQKDLNSSSGKT